MRSASEWASSPEETEAARKRRGGREGGVAIDGSEGGGDGRKGAGSKTEMPLKQLKTAKGVEDAEKSDVREVDGQQL